MKKTILLLLFFFIMAGVWTIAAEAVETPLPHNASMVYNVTVNEVEVYNSTTGAWVTVSSTPVTFNIASAAAANTVIGDMISGVALPNGTYTRFRWEVSSTFGIKACETGTNRCTNGTQQVLGAHTFSAAAALTYATASTTTTIIDFTDAGSCPADTATVDYTCAADSLQGDEDMADFVVDAGGLSKTANLSIDVNNVMKHYTANHFGAGTPEVITPGTPSVDVTFE